jgi:hypothetical protein
LEFLLNFTVLWNEGTKKKFLPIKKKIAADVIYLSD